MGRPNGTLISRATAFCHKDGREFAPKIIVRQSIFLHDEAFVGASVAGACEGLEREPAREARKLARRAKKELLAVAGEGWARQPVAREGQGRQRRLGREGIAAGKLLRR